MKTTPIPDLREGDNVLYNIYQDLPVGAAFLDAKLKVLSANRKMRDYFPYSTNGPEGLLIGDAIRCQQFTTEQFRACENSCHLLRGVQTILTDNQPMQEYEWKHIYYSKQHRQVRWFRVSGTPVSYDQGRYAVLFFNDITAQVKQEKMLLEKLKLDLSTKVLNKTSLIHYLNNLILTENRSLYTLCMVDFDNFKDINDRYGHLMGDRVLNSFCRISHGKIRACDILGRYGGDEFLFIFKARQEQSAAILCRIQNELQKTFSGDLTLPVSFSVGMISCDQSCSDWKSLINEADHLLYQAKANGKNQIVLTDTKQPCKFYFAN